MSASFVPFSPFAPKREFLCQIPLLGKMFSGWALLPIITQFIHSTGGEREREQGRHMQNFLPECNKPVRHERCAFLSKHMQSRHLDCCVCHSRLCLLNDSDDVYWWVAQLQNDFAHTHAGGHVGFHFNGVVSQTNRSLPKCWSSLSIELEQTLAPDLSYALDSICLSDVSLSWTAERAPSWLSFSVDVTDHTVI